MFSFKRKLTADNFSGLIPEKTLITGRVKYSGAFRVDGTVEGDLIPTENIKDAKDEYTVILGPGGTIDANLVHCRDAIIGGTLKAKKLIVHGVLRLEKTAKLTGVNIFYADLQIDRGAFITDCHLTNISEVAQPAQKAPAPPTDK
jgi:cytoskeletal protein CcmA (bactofilin family)